MSHEIKNTAVELSMDELETVAGGYYYYFFYPDQNANLSANANFNQKDLAVAQQTFAGPGGAGNALVVQAREIDSNSSQYLSIFQY